MIGGLTGGADDLLVALVADQQDVVVVAGEALGLVVHLGDQRAGGVDDLQLALGGSRVHGRRDAVGGEHHDRAFRHLVVVVDEDRAGLGQRLHHVAVVHDLVPHVDRGAVLLQRPLDGFDGAVHAGAVAARLGQQHALTAQRLDHRAGGARDAHVDGWWHANRLRSADASQLGQLARSAWS